LVAALFFFIFAAAKIAHLSDDEAVAKMRHPAAEENQNAGCDYSGDGGGCGAVAGDAEFEGFSGGDSWG